MLVITVLVITICFFLFLWFHKVRKFEHLPRSSSPLPFFGTILGFFWADQKKIIENQKLDFVKAKSKYKISWLFNWPLIDSMDVRLNEEMLKSTVFINKTYGIWNDWLGTGLLASNGEKWKARRRLLTPAFHFDVLKHNVKIMNQHAKEFVSHVNNNFSNGAIEFAALSKRFSLNIICETAMGVKCHTYDDINKTPEGEYVNAVDNILQLFMIRVMKPWFYNSFLYRYFSADGKKFYHYLDIAQKYAINVIEARIEKLAYSEEIVSGIFLDILISAYKRGDIDKEGILEEVNTFMFAGHDTVSAALSWTIYLLGRNEEVQRKVADEIESMSCDELDTNSLSQMKYLECVIKESLRLHPPVPFFSRSIFKDVTVLNNTVNIPAGPDIVFYVLHMHRDESLWKNAMSFYPERFLEENIKEKQNPFAFIPFSAGPRNCIGQRFAMMELKIALFHLLKNFRFVSVQAENELEERLEIIHRSANGIWVNASRR